MMDPDPARAAGIMEDFARLTGLDPAGPPKRYLWTDAFAVCNCLGLSQRTKEERFRDLGLRLVDQVHHALGRHRPDDTRTGWISGLGEAEGEEHPTAGGLRIGKRLPERRRDDPADERVEWDRDGQYYHYLTKWMHALGLAGRATGDPRYLRWAMELAKVAHARFVYTPPRGSRKRMYWKMSTDLSYPLVASMGQHDPLDGLVTYCDLQRMRSQEPGPETFPDLTAEIEEMAGICAGMDLASDDPLGTGGLLSDALLIADLIAQDDGGLSWPGLDLQGLLGSVMEAALFGLDAFSDSGCTRLPADYRLAFRELGLAIGLRGVGAILRRIHENPARFGTDSSLLVQAEALLPYIPLGKAVTGFWLEERNQASGPWGEHREINMVMLATSLVPEAFPGI